MVFQSGSVLKNIGDKAFFDCEELTNIEFNEGLEFIGEDSFLNTGIREITLPTSLKRIANCSFGCENNIVLHISDTTEIGPINGNVRICPRKDPRVPEKLFSDLKTIKVLELPEGIGRIGCCWFMKSSVEKVIIPASVKEIGSHAFDRCEKLKEVVF